MVTLSDHASNVAGGVQNDHELRVSFETESSIAEAIDVIGTVHNYDVPMIISDLPRGSESGYWKGCIPHGGALLADKLASSRMVACAQVAPDGSIAVKTTSKAKQAVDRLTGGEVGWVGITGNNHDHEL